MESSWQELGRGPLKVVIQSLFWTLPVCVLHMEIRRPACLSPAVPSRHCDFPYHDSMHMCECLHVGGGALRGQNRASFPLEQVTESCEPIVMGAGTELGSPGSAGDS